MRASSPRRATAARRSATSCWACSSRSSAAKWPRTSGSVNQPQHDVAILLGHRAHASEQRLRHVVLRQQVAQIAQNLGRNAVQPVEDVQHARPQVLPGPFPLRRAAARRAGTGGLARRWSAAARGQRGQHLNRGLRAPGLLEPHVIVGRHPGEHRDLLAAQPRRTPPRPLDQPDVSRGSRPRDRRRKSASSSRFIPISVVILPLVKRILGLPILGKPLRLPSRRRRWHGFEVWPSKACPNEEER